MPINRRYLVSGITLVSTNDYIKRFPFLNSPLISVVVTLVSSMLLRWLENQGSRILHSISPRRTRKLLLNDEEKNVESIRVLMWVNICSPWINVLEWERRNDATNVWEWELNKGKELCSVPRCRLRRRCCRQWLDIWSNINKRGDGNVRDWENG